jgi:hypothetical protein
MSIFASQVQKTAPIPSDPPHTFTYRKLTGRELEDAQAEHLRAFVGGRNPRIWSGTLRQILAQGTTAANDYPTISDLHKDPLVGYDRYAMIHAALLSWTYDGAAKPKREQIDDLDDDAADLIARAILQLSKPSLFQTPEERAAAKKND